MGKQAAPKRIGLLGPFGFGNLGDAAIQQAMIQHIQKEFPDAQIYGFSLNPADTRARHGIPTYPLSRNPEEDFTKSNDLWKNKSLPGKIAGWFQYNPNPFIRKLERIFIRIPAEFFLVGRSYHHLKGLDALFFSGGGQLDDLWGGPWKHPFVLFKFSLLARLRGIKVFFISVGVEGISTFFGKFFIKVALSQACYKSFRDNFSKAFVEQNKLDTKPDHFVYPDLAHSIDIDMLNTSGIVPGNQMQPVVGVNLVPFYDPRYWPIKDARVYQNYLSKMASLVAWLMEKQYRIKFIRSDIYADHDAIVDFLEVLKQRGVKYPNDQIEEPPIQTVDELVEQLRDVDFLIASRLHSLLLAIRVSKPVLALSYQSKIDKMMEDTGQADFCFQADSFDVETVKQRFLNLVTNCETVERQLSQRSRDYRAALDEQYQRIFRLI